MASPKRRKKKSEPGDFDARRGQWLKGILDLCVIGLIGDDTTYGYELATRFEQAGLGTIKGGTLYPRLSAMEDDGLLIAEWRPGDGGPGRKYYRVSDSARQLLADGALEWGNFAEIVKSLLNQETSGAQSSNMERKAGNVKVKS